MGAAARRTFLERFEMSKVASDIVETLKEGSLPLTSPLDASKSKQLGVSAFPLRHRALSPRM